MAGFSTLKLHSGDVVVADFPGITGTKRRPALVVSTGAYHAARPDVILGLLTGQVAAATSPTDYRLEDWAEAGLHVPSAFRTFLITLPQVDVVAVIGHLSGRDWVAVQDRLRISIAV